MAERNVQKVATKVFKSGGSKAIRLPAGTCNVGDEMLVRVDGKVISIIAKKDAWKAFQDAIDAHDAKAPIERHDQGKHQARKLLD